MNKFLFNNKVDGQRKYICLTNLFSFGKGKFRKYWNTNDYHLTHSNILKNGQNVKQKAVPYHYCSMVQP